MFSVSPRDIRFTWDLTAAALLLGLPMMVNTLLTSFSGVINNRFLTQYGDLFLAANGVSSKLRMVVSLLIMGICMGIQPAISYYYGAKDRDRMRHILRVTLLSTTVIGIALSVVGGLFREPLMSLFLNDEEVIRYGSVMVLCSLVGGPFQGLLQLSISYLQGTGSVSAATGFSLFRQIVHILLLVGMNALFGFMGLAFSSSVTTILCAVAGVLLCGWQAKKRWDAANQHTGKQIAG